MKKPSKSQFGPFLIDVQERVLRRDGEPVPLTPKAFDLLTALVEQPGRLLTKEELLQKVWPDTFVEEANLAYNVFALRKALRDTAENGQYIETVPKGGYRFTALVTPVNGANEPPAAVESSVTPPPRAPAISRSFWRRWAVIAGTPILLSAWYFVAQSRPAPLNNEPPRALPLTSLSGVVRSPSMSPDGNHVVFTWTGAKQDNSDLYVQQIGAGSPMRLTTDLNNDYSPSWSPDGRTIAFLRREPAGGKSEVRLIAPLGGSERKLADIQPGTPAYRPTSIAWCPDSRCVLVTDSPGDGKPDGVFMISLDTGEKHQLTYPPVFDADSAISPDGQSLIFLRHSGPFTGQFYRLPLRSHVIPEGEPIRVTSTVSAGRPAWMPDSREIVFAARGWLWRFDALSGATPTRLPFIGQDGLAPVVARTADGRLRLVYVRSFSDANVWRIELATAGLPASSPAAGAIVSTRTDTLPNLSPDGRRVAFVSNRSGESEIWAADPDGSNAVQVTSVAVLPGFPRWSPDGRFIAFHGDTEGRPPILVVPAGGGQPRHLTTKMPNGGFPSFSRDGKWIYFTVLQEGQPRIWKVPVSGGSALQVTTSEGVLAIESYDGRDLYYIEAAHRPSPLWRLPLAGGSAVKVLDGVILGNFDVVEGGIYYIDRESGEGGVFLADRPAGETRLQYFDFASRRSTTVARNLGTVGLGLSASRDGRTVFFSRIDSSVDELMLVEGFR